VTPKYRSDIDGLRAVAVLSVLLFHSGFSAFSGGYVGVDIFFVISGYLITTIIVREIENHDFSISRFYERRFRRILPALVVVVTFSLVTGSLFLTPRGVIDLGQSAIATALFSSNILFYFDSGYFAGAAEMKPLLHTWSLAVEEQYYIFFPLLLVLIAKVNAKQYLRWLVILGILSFIACVILTNIKSSAAFYWTLTRAWELFIGSVLALHVIPKPNKRFLREFYSMLGIIMIIHSVFQFTPQTNFPGIAATLPTIGTALIILSGTGGSSLISAALSLRPIVFIGLISYSLYLWHWPIIVYVKIFSIKEPTESVMAAIFVLIFGLSILSWKYIESPFRKKTLLKEKRSLLVTSAMVSVAIIASGLIFIIYELNINYEVNIKLKDDKWNHWASCEKVVNRIKNNQDLCDIGVGTESTRFILWGDSHARALASGVELSAKKYKLNGKIATQSACPPLLSIERPNRTFCNRFNQAVFEYISNSTEIKTVILAARWALSTKGTRYKQESGLPVQLISVDPQDSANLSNVELFEIGLTRTVEMLHELGKKVVLVNPVPEIGYDVPYAYLIANITGREINNLIEPSVKEYKERTEEVETIFRQLKDQMPIDIVTPDAILCNNGSCSVAIDNKLLYRDDDHLSTFGSEYISEAFDKVFDSTPNSFVKYQ